MIDKAYLQETLTDMMTQVDDFQKKILELPCVIGPLPAHRFKFKIDHMREEIDEFEKAYDDDVFENQVDALIDLIYVAMGALLEMGVLPHKAFDTVHDANMKKVRGETKRGESYDAMKPEGWTPPDHSALITNILLRAAVRPALLEATAIMLERGAAYNGGSVKREDHFPLGMTSIFTVLWIKIIRMRSDIESGRTINRDHLRDLINYAGFGMDILDGRPLE